MGYEPIPALKCDYKDNYLSSYNLPTDVTLKLSNGNTVIGKTSYSWKKIQGDMGAGNTITVQNTVDRIADADDSNRIDKSKINGNDGDYFYVTMQIEFTAPENMLSIDWDTDKTYNWNENVSVNVNNFKGSANDIKLTQGYGSGKVTLTVGNGLTYNAETKTITIDSEKLLNGTVSSVYATLSLGSSTFNMSIKYTTDCSVKFEGIAYGSPEYSSISRKKAFTTNVTFTNVPAEDAQAATFAFGSGDTAEGITLTATKTENVYKLTVPFDAVKDHLSTSYYGGDSATLIMRVRGMSSVSIRLSYMGAPALKADKNSYYASENPVLTLRNFSFDKESMSTIEVACKAGEDKTTLKVGEDYTVDTENKTITLVSEKLLGASSLAEAKTVTIVVSAAADDESAEVTLSYKKDRSLTVGNVSDLSPYAAARAQLSGSEEGYDGLEVYYGDTKLENVKVVSTGPYGAYTYFAEIPYASIKDYLGNSTVTLTAKLSGVSTPATFTVTYGTTSENGPALPISGKIGDSYGNEVENKQGDLPKVSYNGTMSLLIADDSAFSEDDWKNMSATIAKKDTPDKQVILGINSVSKDYYSENNRIKAVVLERLDNHQEEMLELFDFNDSSFTSDKADWPVFTITLYKAGYKTASVDVVLYKYIY